MVFLGHSCWMQDSISIKKHPFPSKSHTNHTTIRRYISQRYSRHRIINQEVIITYFLNDICVSLHSPRVWSRVVWQFVTNTSLHLRGRNVSRAWEKMVRHRGEDYDRDIERTKTFYPEDGGSSVVLRNVRTCLQN
jgi:hypothetical protein